MSKILVYLKGFTDQERLCLAQITALWLGSGQIPATTLRTLVNVSCSLFTFLSAVCLSTFFFLNILGASSQGWISYKLFP